MNHKITIGKISHTEIFIKKLIDKFKDQGGITQFNEKVAKVVKHIDYVEVINNKGESYTTKLLILATGSRGFDLQKSLGFEIPDSFMGIYTNTYADESLLDENFNFQYMFHLNPNISPNGPFFFNVGKGRVSTGYLGNKESPDQLREKLERILRNYKKIQPFMNGLKWDRNFITGGISKHPISTMTKDHVIVLGEAAGVVTAFFYEGLLGGLASANIAAKLIKPLLENNSNFSRSELITYDHEIARILLNFMNIKKKDKKNNTKNKFYKIFEAYCSTKYSILPESNCSLASSGHICSKWHNNSFIPSSASLGSMLS